jgi:hypothetical protein
METYWIHIATATDASRGACGVDAFGIGAFHLSDGVQPGATTRVAPDEAGAAGLG